MSILSDRSLRELRPIEPFHEQTKDFGMTYGLGPAGYDVRVKEFIHLLPGKACLASTFEKFIMPDNVIAFVHDKSTWARKFLAVQNTVIEPGWRGYLTLELSNHGDEELIIQSGMPIAQIVFHWLDMPTTIPYKGKYQDQREGVVEAIFETQCRDYIV